MVNYSIMELLKAQFTAAARTSLSSLDTHSFLLWNSYAQDSVSAQKAYHQTASHSFPTYTDCLQSSRVEKELIMSYKNSLRFFFLFLFLFLFSSVIQHFRIPNIIAQHPSINIHQSISIKPHPSNHIH